MYNFPRSRFQLNGGFTLVEMMVVVALLAILVAVAIPTYQGYMDSSKQQGARSVLEQFPILAETFRAETGQMCPSPPCNANGAYVYGYTETDAGVENTVGNRITAIYPDFRAKGTGGGQTASLYHYSVTFTVAGCPTCTITGQATAIPVASRKAPPGNIVGTSF